MHVHTINTSTPFWNGNEHIEHAHSISSSIAHVKLVLWQQAYLDVSWFQRQEWPSNWLCSVRCMVTLLCMCRCIYKQPLVRSWSQRHGEGPVIRTSDRVDWRPCNSTWQYYSYRKTIQFYLAETRVLKNKGKATSAICRKKLQAHKLQYMYNTSKINSVCARQFWCTNPSISITKMHTKGTLTWTTQCTLNAYLILFVSVHMNSLQIDAHSMRKFSQDCMIDVWLHPPWVS